MHHQPCVRDCWLGGKRVWRSCSGTPRPVLIISWRLLADLPLPPRTNRLPTGCKGGSATTTYQTGWLSTPNCGGRSLSIWPASAESTTTTSQPSSNEIRPSRGPSRPPPGPRSQRRRRRRTRGGWQSRRTRFPTERRAPSALASGSVVRMTFSLRTFRGISKRPRLFRRHREFGQLGVSHCGTTCCGTCFPGPLRSNRCLVNWTPGLPAPNSPLPCGGSSRNAATIWRARCAVKPGGFSFRDLPSGVERRRLVGGIAELRDSVHQTADDVIGLERCSHGCSRQSAFDVVQLPPGLTPSDDLQRPESWIAHDQHRTGRVLEGAVQPLGIGTGVLLRHPDIYREGQSGDPLRVLYRPHQPFGFRRGERITSGHPHHLSRTLPHCPRSLPWLRSSAQVDRPPRPVR